VSLIPQSHRDLLDRPIVVALVTVNPDGQPQATPVWIDYDGERLSVNSAAGRQKVKNMLARPQVTVLSIDPDNPYRWLEVRGTITAHDAVNGVDLINKLSLKYRGVADYYSRMPDLRGKETRISFIITPKKVLTGG